MISPDMTVAEVLRKKPAAKRVLFKYGICDCCGGNVKIKDAAEFRGLKVEDLIREIEEV
ncbi:DUF542 domain-containing protein [Ferroglobus sp.]|uniref:DUF542 domain-containing protein n=1 Tax=Ferroglobus sp. TaxID=2614230 RepID=UPI0025C154C4|nr:DUF542 domain-containing protein [Ferroglobus sp.]